MSLRLTNPTHLLFRATVGQSNPKRSWLKGGGATRACFIQNEGSGYEIKKAYYEL